MDSFTRFLNKLRELIKGKVKDGDLTAEEFDAAVASARGHVGGTIRWENARAEGNSMNEFKLMGEIALAGDGKTATIQVFPAVGKYNHPRYGELAITPEFLKTVKKNFEAKVYQQELPLTIDLEHESSLSGAAGWIASLDIRGNTGMWATIDFNERGQQLVAEDAYRYFSPEFYDEWQDPATNQQYKDLLIGGALTNRPFFKGMAPVAMMSEGALCFVEAATKVAEAVVKTEGGTAYPAEAFLYVPDPAANPSEWKLRIWDASMKPSKAQMGAAAAALGPGYRGNKVELPAGDKAKCIAKLKAMYIQMGVKPGDMPTMQASLTEAELSEAETRAVLVDFGLVESHNGGTGMGMTEEEARKFVEMGDSLKTLNERLATAEAKATTEADARKTAETEAKTASERVTALEGAATRKELTEHVRANRLAYQGEVEEAVVRLEKLAIKLGEEDFGAYLDEHKAIHAQMKESALFTQIGNSQPVIGGVAAEFQVAVRKVMSEDKISESEATVRVATENPGLYKRYDDAFKARTKRGGE